MLKMSSLKRSRPEHQDAILKKLQEISSSRMESDQDEYSSSDYPTSNIGEQRPHGSKDNLEVTQENTADVEKKTGEMFSPKHIVGSPNSLKPVIPNLMVTPENDVLFSNSDGTVSSACSSPQAPIKSQHLVKGLYALSVSDTSDCPSSQLSSNRTTNILPSFYSPKLGRRFESVPDYKSATSSPTSPSRKYFRLMSSPTSLACGARRGSEPLLDGKDLSEVQMSMTDRRWEKLRSILVAMKNEPFDVDSAPDLSTPEVMSNLKENIDMQEELSSLRKELSALHVELEVKDSKINDSLHERNQALAYIKKMKLADKEFEDENKNEFSVLDENTTVMGLNPDESLKKGVNVAGGAVYTKEIERLKKGGATKDDVISTLTRVVDELQVERSYLNHLMSVVLDRAPWMLDEVDRGGHWMDDVMYSSEDDEVWC